MASTYEPIATNTLSVDTASVTFSSISSAYTDLVLVCSVKGSTSGAYGQMRLNSDTGTNYSQTSVYGNGSSAGSARNSSVSWAYPAQNNNVDTTNFTSYIINFMNYTNTTTYKTMISRNGSAAYVTEALVTLWRSTSAINSILFQLNLGNLAAGSTFTLYGIKAA